jgi:hypothetical protein
MKNTMFLLALLFAATACEKPTATVNHDEKWNGYQHYLKMGEQVHTLWAGRHLVIGTATYGIDEDANFYVTYDCSTSDWIIRQSHLFAGDKQDIPVNRRSQPRVCRFPYHAYHYQGVKTYTYRIPLTTLPPAEEPGFAVAAQCVVTRDTKCHHQEKTAWAEGDFRFTDKGPGWYDVFYYNQEDNEFTILYCITVASDSLRLYHLDITHQVAELTYTEYVGNTAGSYDAAAFDDVSGMFFFARLGAGELWVNDLQDDDSSFMAGTLSGDPFSADFYDGVYYYVDDQDNTLHGVGFDENWLIASDIILDTIPGIIGVSDIAMDPFGERLYITAEINGGNSGLICWEPLTATFYNLNLSLDDDAQIAFGSDGLLYAISPLSAEVSMSTVSVIDTESDTLTVIEEEIIYIEDPFSDISRGPIM